MTRPIVVLWTALVLALSSVAGAGPALAGPPPPCSFTLTPPQVAQIDGVSTVTATLAPAGCGSFATPYLSVACLEIQGDGSSKQCTQARGSTPAQITYASYRPGATYVSTGRGCANFVGQSIEPRCQPLGPYAAVL